MVAIVDTLGTTVTLSQLKPGEFMVATPTPQCLEENISSSVTIHQWLTNQSSYPDAAVVSKMGFHYPQTIFQGITLFYAATRHCTGDTQNRSQAGKQRDAPSSCVLFSETRVALDPIDLSRSGSLSGKAGCSPGLEIFLGALRTLKLT